MAQTIETFIDKLRTDGVEAGREAAGKIRAEAEQRAAEIVRDAEQRGAKIVAEAQAEAEKVRERTRTDLELAARDTVVRLQQTLGAGLNGVIQVAVQERLADADFLGSLIREVVAQYVQSDLAHGSIAVNVSEPMRHKLAEWAIQTLHKDLDQERSRVELHGTLAEAGFEYRVGDGTVEITTGSVVEVLSEMAAAELRQIITRAVANGSPMAKAG